MNDHGPTSAQPSSVPEATALMRIAEGVAREAGALVTAMLAEAGGRSRLHASADRKSSATDLSTEADQASERLIAAHLSAVRPDDALIAEESASHGGTSPVSWVVDPIDGTTNFVYGYGSFAISIAAVVDGRSIAGVVHDPTRDETFTATLHGGAFRNGQPLVARSTSPPLGECLLGTGFGYRTEVRRRQGRIVAELLPLVRDIRRGGSAALDLCYVAAGRLDAYYESGLGTWDRAAGELVARETGLETVDLDHPAALAGTLVVAPEQLCATLVDCLTKAASR